MKFKKATKILDGELRYTVRQFKEDLRRELDCEMEKEELRVIIVLNAKFDTYLMRKVMPTPETTCLVADDFFGMSH